MANGNAVANVTVATSASEMWAALTRTPAAVVVLGHPTYYPRFGFEPASRHGLRCPYDAPDEAFMVVPLMPGHLAGLAGTVEYHAAFAPIEGSAQ